MLHKLRRLWQSAFLVFGSAAYAGLIESKDILSIYNSFHIFPVISSIAALATPQFLFLTVAVVALAALIGRFYCSFLCPMGLLQDLSRKIGRRLGYFHVRAADLPFVHYSILAVCLYSVLTAGQTWGWFDHISNFGRIVADLFRPLVNVALTPFAGILNKTKFQIDETSLVLRPDLIYALLVFTAIAALSVRWPRWFCSVICPSGAVYSIISRFGFFNIMRTGKCPSCKKCEKACPAGCIIDGVVDHRYCVGCFECTRECPFNSVSIALSAAGGAPRRHEEKRSAGDEKSRGRREFIKKMGFACAAVAGVEALGSALAHTGELRTIMPPGAESAGNLFARCSGCHACVSACPTKVLVPSWFENGLAGLSKPRMDFTQGYCSYECNLCQKICPTGAIRYNDLAIKQVTRVGKVELDTGEKSECVPIKEKKDCGACAEHCPSAAVYMKKTGNIFIPELREKYCIGCGICEHACPVASKVKPIRVVPVAAQSSVPLFADEEKAPGAGESAAPAATSGEKTSEFPF